MNVEIKIDENCKDTRVLIITEKINEEVNEIVKRLSVEKTDIIAGYKDNNVNLFEPSEIMRIYSADQKVFICTEKDEYISKQRLYVIEEKLDKKMFIRISNSEIINLKKVVNFDLSFAGTICVKLINGTKTYVSRRYISKIKQALGI